MVADFMGKRRTGYVPRMVTNYPAMAVRLWPSLRISVRGRDWLTVQIARPICAIRRRSLLGGHGMKCAGRRHRVRRKWLNRTHKEILEIGPDWRSWGLRQ
jgi:hypothetical protein